jgi:acetyl esterase/lipase
MKRTAIGSTLALTLCFSAAVRAADAPVVIDVWPGKAPGETAPIGEESITGKQGSRRVTNVSQPTLSVFRPEKEKDTGAAVIIAPGGAYRFLSWDHEGEDVARWLNSIGVTGIVLKYRVPVPPEAPKDGPSYPPLQDAQRSMSLVRSKAKEWGIDPNRIGFLGFSAGGNLAALVATNNDKRGYEPIDAADTVSSRPDFAVLVYPGTLERGSDQIHHDVRVTKDTPPTFLMHCTDDPGGPQNSVMMYLALKRAGVPAELHVYSVGGHGFGMRPSEYPSSQWPKRCEEWLRAQGILKPDKGS